MKNRRRMRSVITQVSAMLVLLSFPMQGVGETIQPLERTGVEIGTAAPAFEATTIDDQKISLADFKDKVTAVVFWATWCSPCKPLLRRLGECYERYHSDGFEVVAFSLDEDPLALSTYLEKTPYPWRQNVRLGDIKHPISKRYHLSVLPTVFLLDKNGIIRADAHALRASDDDKRMTTEPSADDMIRALLFAGKKQEGVYSRGAVEGVVIRDGEFAEISANLRLLDTTSKPVFVTNKTHAAGCYAFHGVGPGTYWLQIEDQNSGMASETGKWCLSKVVHVLEGVQWHNFQFRHGTATIHCPRGDSYFMWLRQRRPNNDAMVEYGQSGYVRDLAADGRKYDRRDKYSFTGLDPGQYEYRIEWLRDHIAYVQGGRVEVDVGSSVTLEAAMPQGPCKITGTIKGIREDLSAAIVFIRKPTAEPIVYSGYYEMGTWDTVALVRGGEIVKTGQFTCSDLPAGEYVVTAAQLQDRQYGVPIVQKSQSIRLSSEAPEASISFDLSSGE